MSVGLTEAQIKDILNESINTESNITAEGLKNAIAKAIVANNKAIERQREQALNDMQRHINSNIR